MPLTGKDLESWLARSDWKQLPDFLDMSDQPVAGRLCKRDLTALRHLASGGTTLDLKTLASLQRLYQHGIVKRRVEGAAVYFEMTPRAWEVLKMNVSFRVTTKEGEPA